MQLAAKTDLLGLLARAQEGEKTGLGNGSAPVTVQIGYLGAARMVCHDGVLITDAPATVVTEVMDWVEKQRKTQGNELIMASVYGGGLLVH